MDLNNASTALQPYGIPAAQYGYGYSPAPPQGPGYAPSPSPFPSGYGHGNQTIPQNTPSMHAFGPSGGALVPWQGIQPQMPGFPNVSPPAYRPPDPPARVQTFHERLYHFVALKSSRDKISDEESALALLNQDENCFSPSSEKLEKRCTTMEVLQSRCIAPLEEESFETVHLTISDKETKVDEKESHKAIGDIRWVHINSGSLELEPRGISLNDFRDCAIKTPGLDKKDQALIGKLLETVQSKNEKHFIYGSYLDPIVGQFNPESSEDIETGEAEAKTARFYCLPYFSLDKFPPKPPPFIPPPNVPRIHPARTLLQTHYQLQSTENRDKRQVTRKPSASQDVIYVPQVWCLLVNSVHVITCAPGDVRDVFRDIINIEDPSSRSKGRSQPTIIRFTDWTGEVYFLPYDKCQTWFGLLETIGTECRPISDDMANENKPNGWEIILESNQAINDQNWIAALAESDTPILNINLQWKPSIQPQDPNYPGYGFPSQATDTLPHQNIVMPYGPAAGYSPHPPSGFGGIPPGSLTAAAPVYGGTTNTAANDYEPDLPIPPSSVAVHQIPVSPENLSPRSMTPESEGEAIKLAELEKQIRREVAEATARARSLRTNRRVPAGSSEEGTATRMNAEAEAEAFAAMERANQERIALDARELAIKVEFWRTMEKRALDLELAIEEAKKERELAEGALKVAEELKRSRDLQRSWEQTQEAKSAENTLELAHLAIVRAAMTMEEAEVLQLEAFNIWQETQIIAEQNEEKMKRAPPIMLRASNERLYSFPFQACWHWEDMENLVREIFSTLPDISELADYGCYDLVVDDTIILPLCWTDLVEPGWNVEIQFWPARPVSDTDWSDTSSSCRSQSFYAKVHRRDKQTWRYIRKGKVMRATRNYLWRHKCRRMANQQWSAGPYFVSTMDAISLEYQSSDYQSSKDQISQDQLFGDQLPEDQLSEGSSEAQSFEAQIEFPYTVEEASDNSSPETPIFNRGPRMEEILESDTEQLVTHGTEYIQADTTTNRAEEPLEIEQSTDIRSIGSAYDHAEESAISWSLPGPSQQRRIAGDNFSNPNLATESQNSTQLNLEPEHATTLPILTAEAFLRPDEEIINTTPQPTNVGVPKDSHSRKESQKSVRNKHSRDAQFNTTNFNGTESFITTEKTAKYTPLEKEGNDKDLLREQGPTATTSMLKNLPTPKLFSGEAILDEPSQGLRLHLKKLTMDSRFHLDISTSGLSMELTITAVQELGLISTHNFWWERFKEYYRAIHQSEIDPIHIFFDESGFPRMVGARSFKRRRERRSSRQQARRRPPPRTARRAAAETARARTFRDPKWPFTLPGRSSSPAKGNGSDASSNVQNRGYMSDITEDIYDVSDAGPSHENIKGKGKERSTSIGAAVPLKPRPAYVEDEEEEETIKIHIGRESPSTSDSQSWRAVSTISSSFSRAASVTDSTNSSRATKPSRSTKSSGITVSSTSTKLSGSTTSSFDDDYSLSSKENSLEYYSESSSASGKRRITRTKIKSGRPLSRRNRSTRGPARIQQRSRRPSVQAHSENQIFPYGTDFSHVSNPFSPAPSYPFSPAPYGYFPPSHNYSFISPPYNAQSPYPQVPNSGGNLPGTSMVPKPPIEDKKSLYYTPSTAKPKPPVADSNATHALISSKGKVEIKLEPTTIPTAQGAEPTSGVLKLPSSMKQPQLPPKTKPIPSVAPIFMWPVWQEDETSGNDNTKSLANDTTPDTPKLPKKTEESPKDDYKWLMRVLEDAKSALDVYLEAYQEQKLLLGTCRPSSRQEVDDKLKSTRSGHGFSMEERKDLVEIALRLLEAFVHKVTSSELVDLFYGALLEILQPPKFREQIGVARMFKYTELYMNIITEIRNGVSASSSLEKPQHAIPIALFSAFQHLVMVFCIFSKNVGREPDLVEAENMHHRRCEQLLLEGKTQLIRMYAGDLSKAKTCKGIDSNGLVALILTRLLVIKEGSEPASNIIATYRTYLSKIELEVRDSPSVRGYEDIQDLVEELQIIETIMRQQRAGLESSLTLCTATTNISDVFALQVFQKGLRHLDKQLNHVTELLRLAEDKKTLLSQAINVRKETNSVSILIFTAITVIFLPLSFITSYLTISDAQLVFWEAAIPTAVVILAFVWLLVKFRRRLKKGFNRATRSAAEFRKRRLLYLNRS